MCKARRPIEVFFNYGNQQIIQYGVPNLHLHCVLPSIQKSCYAQVLFDPLEEQFNLPSDFVQRSNDQGRQRRVVGHKHRRLSRCRVFEFHPTQMFSIVSYGVKAVQCDALASEYTAGSVCCTRVQMVGVHTELGPDNKKSPALKKFKQSSKIQIAPLHDVEGARFERQDVGHVHIAEFAVADMDENGDCPSQIQQRVHLHSRFSRAKSLLIEQTQTQVDCGGVQRVGGCIEISVHRRFDVEFPGIGNQAHNQRMINVPDSQIRAIGQSQASGNDLDAHVKQLRLIGSEAHLNIAQRFASGQSCKRHHAKYID
jgi:hypothetical protein